VNQHRRKNPNYDFVFNADMIAPDAIVQANRRLIETFGKNTKG
jgi:hypothetical protein